MTTPLERLTRLAPPADRPGPTDWADAESRLGHPLPGDYKELVDAYGPGEFDGHVRLRAPEGPNGGRGLIAMNDGYFEELEDIWEMNEEAPEEIEEEGTTLVVWARTKDAETLNWLVRPGTSPDEWPVMVLNDDLTEWETYPVTATEFLAGLLAGDIDSAMLSSELTPPDHTFEPRQG
ncbi:SMI1/KNR4 family protein [Actinacidiphila acidipaludis]|uniref:SMI1/KNR4 family protein n=1 Tax=Actinacidiphila acidipaludis TaxID=2873382 RepID=A0ABS7QF30_9ACTN|nr:SMI1/KNR4 family protein [Streptomyces acidipaludis]MBY8881771.1 SMI1/KNR4 family protein [Streptomyces acidipaludis]